MSLRAGDSPRLTGSSEYLSDPGDGPPSDGSLGNPTPQLGQAGSEEGTLPLMAGHPPGLSGADAGSSPTRSSPPASAGHGRHGSAHVHRRRESPPPPLPPPPPEFDDSATGDQSGAPRIPVPPAAGSGAESHVSVPEVVPVADQPSQLRSPRGEGRSQNQHSPGRPVTVRCAEWTIDLSTPTCSAGVDGGPDCAICLQVCVHPVQLPCLHVFCFLCAKGAIKNSRRCAMCRSEVPADYLDNPLLLNTEQLQLEMALSDGYQWYYEGRNGWWKYDERTAADLEAAFTGGEKRAELLVAGYRYVVDFETMLQLRRSDPARRRRVKRDLASAAKKGVAGIRVGGAGPPEAEAGLVSALQDLTLTEDGQEEAAEDRDSSAL